MQVDNELIDRITNGVIGVVGKVGETRWEMIRLIREAVQEGVEHFDIVTREEFDVVKRMASDTRIRLEEAEARLAALEAVQPATAKPATKKVSTGRRKAPTKPKASTKS
ncbi:MAG: accessory factor UbiK family protein [Magnetococcales bacterium]|nr:accessory factor UbiK family protein [Magnetococcales bacterium]